MSGVVWSSKQLGTRVDILSREESFPILVQFLEESVKSSEGRCLPITNRTLVLLSRYLWGWSGLFTSKPPKLTEKGAFLLYKKWTEEGKVETGT